MGATCTSNTLNTTGARSQTRIRARYDQARQESEHYATAPAPIERSYASVRSCGSSFAREGAARGVRSAVAGRCTPARRA
jgi:hypothetical protein